jgi:hypothetical protein
MHAMAVPCKEAGVSSRGVGGALQAAVLVDVLTRGEPALEAHACAPAGMHTGLRVRHAQAHAGSCKSIIARHPEAKALGDAADVNGDELQAVFSPRFLWSFFSCTGCASRSKAWN